MKLAQQKLSKYNTEVTPTTAMLPITAHILEPSQKLLSFRQWDMGMDTNPEDETSYTTQYQQAFLKFVERESCAKHWCVPVKKHGCFQSINLIHCATASGSCQSSFDLYDLSSDDEEYLTPTNVAETTPWRRDFPAHLLTAARLNWNSAPEAPMNCVRINPNLNDDHSDPMQISWTCW